MIKKSRTIFVLTAILVIVFLMQPLPQAPIVEADSNQPLTFSSGLIVYSRVNTVYNSYSVLCNVSLRVPYGYQSSIAYSIDGIEQDQQNGSRFNLNFGSSEKYHSDGLFMLPALHNGPHQLSFKIDIELFNYSGPPPSSDFKAGITAYGVKFYEADYENTISFTINSNEPFPTPTPTFTPTLNPSATPTATVPELSFIIVIAIIIAVLTLAVSVFKRKIH